ncbi:helix-turn-helix domain-containing protein [Lederbergia citrea]|uniref:Helix-turn-helix domain-containing protein n=2 Tax=Lederbergia citrea TaxID=2833581 RepID=A0A942UMQ2_9BACI|nr:helix-turn-helix domain-containing protein [Lederbergia citrea]MBS4176135.1 helix-turn-helix domain-containing protein [Lederbergia citrea]MBS4222637.1 helix-turn-helix domain-containing protein [Lederbergia citrea]
MTENLNNPAIFSTIPSPGVLICDHFNQLKGYKVHRSEGTKDWLITYTISGKGQFKIGDHVQLVKKGDIAILKPKTVHQYATYSSHWEFIWAHFLPRETWFDLLKLPEMKKGLLYLGVDQPHLQERVLGSFQRLIRDNRGFQSFAKELSLNALEEILLAVNQWLQTNDKNKIDLRVQQVLGILSENLKESHSIESLSKQVALSPSRLSHLFREQVGDSIMATLLSMRLRHAARLLEFTNRAISEIADDVGFSSPFYFTKQFTAFFGMNPRDFRKKMIDKTV